MLAHGGWGALHARPKRAIPSRSSQLEQLGRLPSMRRPLPPQWSALLLAGRTLGGSAHDVAGPLAGVFGGNVHGHRGLALLGRAHGREVGGALQPRRRSARRRGRVLRQSLRGGHVDFHVEGHVHGQGLVHNFLFGIFLCVGGTLDTVVSSFVLAQKQVEVEGGPVIEDDNSDRGG